MWRSDAGDIHNWTNLGSFLRYVFTFKFPLNTKHLGISINQNWNFNDRITVIRKKANISLGALKLASWSLTQWFLFGGQPVRRTKLQRIQNRGIRIIWKCRPFKKKNSATPNYMSDWFTQPTHQYPTPSSTSGDLYVSIWHIRNHSS